MLHGFDGVGLGLVGFDVGAVGVKRPKPSVVARLKLLTRHQPIFVVVEVLEQASDELDRHRGIVGSS